MSSDFNFFSGRQGINSKNGSIKKEQVDHSDKQNSVNEGSTKH